MESTFSSEDLTQLVAVLSAMPSEVWNKVKADVAANRRESSDTTTKAGAKLFGPGIEAGITSLALVFTDGKSGVYNVEARESGKGRTGQVKLTLANVTTKETLELNSRDHGALIANCIVQRRERKAGNAGNGNAAPSAA